MIGVFVVGDAVVLVDDAAQQRLAQLLSKFVNTFGDAAPDCFASIVEGIARHRTAQTGNAVDNEQLVAQAGTVSFTFAARRLGVSNDTIGNYVRRGLLDKLGRRILTSSLDDLLCVRGDRPSFVEPARPVRGASTGHKVPQGSTRRRGHRA